MKNKLINAAENCANSNSLKKRKNCRNIKLWIYWCQIWRSRYWRFFRYRRKYEAGCALDFEHLLPLVTGMDTWVLGCSAQSASAPRLDVRFIVPRPRWCLCDGPIGMWNVAYPIPYPARYMPWLFSFLPFLRFKQPNESITTITSYLTCQSFEVEH